MISGLNAEPDRLRSGILALPGSGRDRTSTASSSELVDYVFRWRTDLEILTDILLNDGNILRDGHEIRTKILADRHLIRAKFLADKAVFLDGQIRGFCPSKRTITNSDHHQEQQQPRMQGKPSCSCRSPGWPAVSAAAAAAEF